MRRLVFVLTLLTAASSAHADDTYDLSTDECAAPDSGCIAAPDEPDEATLEAQEAAAPADEDPIVWATSKVTCPAGATEQNGQCIAEDIAAPEVTGGCSSTTPGLGVLALLAILIAVASRRRRSLLPLVIAACSLDAGTWDSAVDQGPTGDASFTDIYAADLPAGTQYLLSGQPLAAGAAQPSAAFSLQSERGGIPILRTTGTCGDHLVTSGAGELLGWARPDDGDGTAALVELVARDGCTFTYETDPDAIDDLIAEGYAITRTVAHVWPPGYGDSLPPDDDATVTALTACTANKHSPIEFLYASPGKDESLRFLVGCPGEVVIGEKGEDGPHGAMTDPSAHARGGRSAFVLDRNGDKLAELLARSNGVERTAAYLRHKLAEGYDYLAIDEITTNPRWADGTSLNRRLRAMLLRVPARTVIPYLSIDLMQYPDGYSSLRARRLLLRAFARRARVIAMEIYLHTGAVMAGAAPATYRRAADRLSLASAVRGINRRAISVVGTSMHSSYAQYRYLDEPHHDLGSIERQVNAIRHASARTRQQRGLGYYFVGKSDMAPPSAYSYDKLIRVMRLQGLRFH